MNGMRPISAARLAIEAEGHRHLVKRGWLRFLHLENMPSLFTLLGYCLKLTLLDVSGRKNALDVQVERVDIALPGLPKGFDGVRLLFVSDLHIDGQERLAEKLIGLIEYSLADRTRNQNVSIDERKQSLNMLVVCVIKQPNNVFL